MIFEICWLILVLDILFLLSLRLGYENTRLHMNDSIRAFFACFQSACELPEDTNRSRAVSLIRKRISPWKICSFLSILSFKGSATNRANSLATAYSPTLNASSVDADEFCRITIDSLTNSYKIGSPVKPHSLNGRQTRSVSHSLLITTYTEGKKKASKWNGMILFWIR